jgi:hypothetical protein
MGTFSKKWDKEEDENDSDEQENYTDPLWNQKRMSHSKERSKPKNSCASCEDKLNHMPFICKYCDKTHCSNCRLPEEHNCNFSNKKKKRKNNSKTPQYSSTNQTYKIKSSNKKKKRSRKMSKRKKIKFAKIGLLLIIMFLLHSNWGFISDYLGTNNFDLGDTKNNLEDKKEEVKEYFEEVFEEPVQIFEEELSINVDIIESKILELVNIERSEQRVGSLKSSTQLDNYARKWSDKMLSENFFKHSNLDFQFKTIAAENIAETPIHYSVVGCGATYTNEELAECFVSGWISSSGHHENMITRAFTRTGIGVACDNTSCMATQVFWG